MPCILVIDSDEACLRLTQKLLIVHGFEVLTARDHFEGFIAIQRASVDLILIDFAAPSIDGWLFMRSIQDDLDFKHIPIIAFTTWDSAQAEFYQANYSFIGFIGKPVNTREFANLVKSLLKIHTKS